MEAWRVLLFLEWAEPWYALIVMLSVAAGILSLWYHNRQNTSNWKGKAPKATNDHWPLLGALRFFNARWDFHKQESMASPSGAFSYYVGQKPVIGLCGDQARKLFFEHKKLDLDQGYQGLFLGGPASGAEDEESRNVGKNITLLLKRGTLNNNLGLLMNDVRSRLDELANDRTGMTDPFNSIYETVFALTMRMVACKELVDDRKQQLKILRLYEQVDAATSPLALMYPGLPTLSKIRRAWGGYQVYRIFDKVVKTRKREGRREEDPFQFFLDRGENVLTIITFVMGALFAGQINSGINAAWVLTHLAHRPELRKLALEEVEAIVSRHVPGPDTTLIARLSQLPLEAWENDFTFLDVCLNESIRLNLNGTSFRRSSAREPIPIPGTDEVIPPDFYVTYPVADVHQDPAIYADPQKYDPLRGIHIDPITGFATKKEPSPAEKPYPFLGWGVARHPCLGMKFAKLEQNIIVAFFLAYFDFELIKPHGRVPDIDLNNCSARKPDEEVLVRYWKRV